MVKKIYEFDDFGEVIKTASGVRCGNHGHERIYHEDAESVKACYQIDRDRAAEQAAEIWAENAWLRAAEYDPTYAGSEEEAADRYADWLTEMQYAAG